MATPSISSAKSSLAPAPAGRTIYCGGHDPVFLVALAFALGVIAANYLWRSPLVWLAAFVLAGSSTVVLYRRFPQSSFLLLLLALVPLGGFYLQARDAASSSVAVDLQAFADGVDPIDVTAHVTREGLIRDGAYGGKQESVDVETERLQSGERVLADPVGIRLTLYSKQAEEYAARESGDESPLRVYTYGERLHFLAKVRMPRNYRNPGAMDLTGYLAAQGVRLTGSAQASSVEVLPGFAGNRLGLWRSAARRSVLQHISSLWPGEPGALMQAALIGGRAFFGREIKTEFQRTGTYHILVVSGINVGILAFAVFWTLRKITFGETWATVLTILLSWGYAFVADLGSPIVRATITLNVYLLTRLLFRDRAGLNALGIAALGILLVNPRTLFEASFQLTFLSVIAVAGIASPILQRTLYPLQRALRNLDSPDFALTLPPRMAQFRFEVCLLRELLGNIIGPRTANVVAAGGARLLLGAGELLFVSTVIQIALTLPMVWYFHRATTMALPANALVIPIAGVLLPSAVLAVGLSYVGHWPAWLPALVSRYALAALTGTIHLIGHMRVSEVRVSTPAAWMCWAGAAALGLALLLARRRMRWAAASIGCLLASTLAIVLWPSRPAWRPGVFEITAIDVGQGDSLLLVTPTGKTLLMDAGGMPGSSRSDFDVGEEVVSPYLWSRGIRRLDVVAVSHAHTDHIGGMRSVIANFRPRELWYGLESPSREFAQVEEAARENHVALQAHTMGETFEFGGVQVRVLNPRAGWEARNPPQDDESLVLRMQYGKNSVLLMGDSHQPIERLLLDEAPQSDLLKVVSVGFYNSYRHPRPDVMERYSEAHVQTYRTDLAGAVSFYLDGTNITATPVPR